MSQETETAQATVTDKAAAAGMTVKDGVLHGKNGTPIGKVATESSKKTDPTPKTTSPKQSSPKPKTSKKTPAVTAKVRSVGDTDMSPTQRRLAVIKAMRKIGAVSATTAATADLLAEKSGLTRFDVYGQLYHANPLQKNGFVKQVQVEGVRGLSYHLTAKGQKSDPE